MIRKEDLAMQACQRIMTRRTKETEILRSVRVAVCGELPTACDYLCEQGIIHIDKFTDATNIGRESDYHLILVYAPRGEGLVSTYYTTGSKEYGTEQVIPVRMLGEPCCHSALLEIKMTVQEIAKSI